MNKILLLSCLLFTSLMAQEKYQEVCTTAVAGKNAIVNVNICVSVNKFLHEEIIVKQCLVKFIGERSVQEIIQDNKKTSPISTPKNTFQLELSECINNDVKPKFNHSKFEILYIDIVSLKFFH
jgi:hypothetical protein